MIKRIIVLFVLTNCLLVNAYSQNVKQRQIRIHGYIYDKTTKETLIGATFMDSYYKAGTITNAYGFYSLSITKGKGMFSISYVGYEKQDISYNLDKDTMINVFLTPSSTLQEVTIKDKAIEKRFVDEPIPGKIYVNPEIVSSMPSLTGESDLLKALQMLPGVKSGTEGTTGLNVRGGNIDQNLYLVDGIPIYNPNHLMGFISTFNTDAIKNIDFYKGSFPSQYGGRVSSVVDVRTKDGNNEKIKGDVSVGLISAKVNLEGPIVKDKTTFSLSARRTYLDLITAPLIKYENNQNNDENVDFGYHFSDVNMKIQHKFNYKSKLTASLYWGEDKYNFSIKDNSTNNAGNSKAKVKWGNFITTLDWAYQLSNVLFTNLSISYNKYKSNINSTYESTSNENGQNNKYNFSYDFISSIEDVSLRNNYNYYLNSYNSIRFGVEYTHHAYSPEITSIVTNDNSVITSPYSITNKKYGNEIISYLEDEINFNKLCITAGLHLDNYNVEGSNYFSLQPRVSFRYNLTPSLSLKGGYAMMNQNIHLLANGIISLPTDLWVPVTKKIKPITSNQVSMGLFYQLKDICEISMEGYYKKLNNVIDYKDGVSSFNNSENWEEKVSQGKGKAYGVEFLIQKEKGNTSGWISYTLSFSKRQYDDGQINAGKEFYDRYDTRHQVNIVLTQKIGNGIDITAAWVFNSGSRTSVPIASYYDNYGYTLTSYSYNNPDLINVYGERNNFKMPCYHRLDIGMNFKKKTKHGQRIWSVNVYNAYNHKNAFFVFTTNKPNKLKAYSIMPIIPTVSYTYKF